MKNEIKFRKIKIDKKKEKEERQGEGIEGGR